MAQVENMRTCALTMDATAAGAMAAFVSRPQARVPTPVAADAKAVDAEERRSRRRRGKARPPTPYK